MKALAEREFFLDYMPTVSLLDHRCLGAEALLRWRRGAEIVSPGRFIPLVENTPLSGLITYWVMDAVMADLGDWLKENPQAYLSINAPPEILGRGGITYVASKSGLIKLAPQLMLEITERGIPDLIGVESISFAREFGVRIALDDVTFVGGANLAVLARCQLDAIKLDKSLIDQIQPQCLVPEWLKTVKALRESSQLLVIAEGVETELQVATLREANIQAAQGFYFSPPLSRAAFTGYFADHRGSPA